MIPPTIIYPTRVRSDPKYHALTEIAQSSFSSLDWVQKRLRVLVGNESLSILQPLSHKGDIVSISLLFRYFHDRNPDIHN